MDQAQRIRQPPHRSQISRYWYPGGLPGGESTLRLRCPCKADRREAHRNMVRFLSSAHPTHTVGRGGTMTNPV
nr:hypothetical protein [Methylomarinum sp. Ch1-1]MDP4521141.1 hypothetical protein [Methylomarinum sp. Ch1-1]